MTYALDVLIPHFNDAQGLRISLDSVARQTWRGRLRVIVADDGSADAEFAKAAMHCEAFRTSSGFDILLTRNPRNLGRPATRNRLLDLVEARHVAWLDAGDVWYSRKLELQFEHLTRLLSQGTDISRVWVTCHYDWTERGRTRPVRQKVHGDQFQSLLVGADLRAYLWTLMGPAEAVRVAGRFDDRLPRLQDLDYFLTFLRGGGQIVVPPGDKPLCRYHKTDAGRRARDVRACYKLILAKHAPALRRYPAGLVSELHYKANRLAARFARTNGQYLTALRYLGLAAVGSPRHTLLVLRRHVARRLPRLTQA